MNYFSLIFFAAYIKPFLSLRRSYRAISLSVEVITIFLPIFRSIIMRKFGLVLLAAFAFIQYVFCTQKKDTDSCGTCPSCLKISKLSHPDLHIVFPIAKSSDVKTSNDLLIEFRESFLENPYITIHDWFNNLSAENKQPLIPTDEAGSILKKLSYTSYEGGYKVMLIWQPETMNAEAANKLLKILEEPPEQTLFILVCNQPDKLLTTILSRVQQLLFLKINPEDISSGLINQFGCQEKQAKEAAFMCDGNYREAQLLLLQHEEEHGFLQLFINFIKLVQKIGKRCIDGLFAMFVG
jgi:DNA polymerase-3 subunit delta'